MSMPTPPTPSAPPSAAGFRLAPGFATRLGIGLCLALLATYLGLAALQAQQAGTLERYALKSDLLTTLTGAQIVLAGSPGQLYDRGAQEQAQTRLRAAGGYPPGRLLPFIHPPFELLLIVPLRAAGLSPGAIFGVWTLISLGALAGSLAALRIAWPSAGSGRALAVLAVLACYPVFVGLLLGQTVAVLLLGWAAGSAALRRRHDGWAGAAFALGLLKPQILPLILIALLVMRRWRALAGFAAIAAGAAVASLVLLGPGWPLQYVQLALSVGGYPPDPILDPAGMQNIRGLLARALGDSALVTTVANLALGLAGAATAILWWRAGRRDGWQLGTPAWDRRWAATLLLTLPVSSYLLAHDLALALAPGWMLAAQAGARRDWRMLAWLWLGWALGLLNATRSLPLPPAVLWLLITAGWLVGSEFRRPYPSS